MTVVLALLYQSGVTANFYETFKAAVAAFLENTNNKSDEKTGSPYEALLFACASLVSELVNPFIANRVNNVVVILPGQTGNEQK